MVLLFIWLKISNQTSPKWAATYFSCLFRFNSLPAGACLTVPSVMTVFSVG